MAEEDVFPSNAKSKRDRPITKEKVEKVISGEVTQRKKPLYRRIRETFIGGEVKSVSRYIGAEVILPAIRNLIVDAATKAIDGIVYGNRPRPARPGPTPYRPIVNYNSYSTAR
jgi:hypothetical protein